MILIRPLNKTHADPNPMDSGTEKLASGEIAYSTGSVGSFRSFWYWSELFGGEPSYIGYPSPERGTHKLIIDSFYINDSSSHKGGALDFLQYLLSEEQQRKIVKESMGFTVNQDLLKVLWEEAKETILNEQIMEKNGLRIEPRLMTEEEERTFWEMLESFLSYDYLITAQMHCVREDVIRERVIEGNPEGFMLPTIYKVNQGGWKAMSKEDGSSYVEEYIEFLRSCGPEPAGMGKLSDIIRSEAKKYFNNQRSLDETVRIIKNRVELYLKEQQ